MLEGEKVMAVEVAAEAVPALVQPREERAALCRVLANRLVTHLRRPGQNIRVAEAAARCEAAKHRLTFGSMSKRPCAVCRWVAAR